MRQPSHQEAWSGAAVFFALFTVLFVASEHDGGHPLYRYFKAVVFGFAVALFCIGWMMRQRERDEPVFRALLLERERRDDGFRDTA